MSVGVNTISFQGQVLALKPLRYTPAGIAVSELTLQHQSVVEQAGIQRQLSFEIDAIAMGDVATLISSVSEGSFLSMVGFLAPLHKSSSRLVLHVQRFQNQSAPPTALV